MRWRCWHANGSCATSFRRRDAVPGPATEASQEARREAASDAIHTSMITFKAFVRAAWLNVS